MLYAPEGVRIDVANAQARIAHVLDELREALDEALTDSTARAFARNGDTDLARWFRVLGTIDLTAHTATRDMNCVGQIDPYAEQDARIAAQYEADLSAAAEEPHPLVPRAGTDYVSASPFAPTPVTHGHAAFGTSHLIPPLETVVPRGVHPDNTFANVFAGPLDFGYVDPSQTEQETAR